MPKPTMAIQLFTLRDHIQTAEDFDRTLQRLQNMGVRDVQISAIGDIPAEVQGEILRKHEMRVCVTHKSFDLLRADPLAAVGDRRCAGVCALQHEERAEVHLRRPRSGQNIPRKRDGVPLP